MAANDLSSRLDALESENQLLHARVAELEATQSATETVLSRRRLLGRAGTIAAAGAGAALGSSMLSTERAAAADGDPLLVGQGNTATDVTVLTTTPGVGNNALQLDVTGNRGLRVNTTGSGGYGISVFADNDGAGILCTRNAGSGDYPAGSFYNTAANGPAFVAGTDHPSNSRNAIGLYHLGLGQAVVVQTSNQSNTLPSVQIEHAGNSPALDIVANNSGRTTTMVRVSANGLGSAITATNNVTTNSAAMISVEHAGTGRLVSALNSNDESNASGVFARVAGEGAGVEGRSDNGRGGVFTGKLAQVRLSPGVGTTHPTGGSRGDLYCDRTGRLWFCKGPNRWAQVV